MSASTSMFMQLTIREPFTYVKHYFGVFYEALGKIERIDCCLQESVRETLERCVRGHSATEFQGFLGIQFDN